MLMQVYSLRDTKSEVYLLPMYAHNHGSAMREIYAAVRGKYMKMVSEYPEDFRLMHIGSFDDQAGLIDGLEPQFVSEVKTIIDAYNEEKQDEQPGLA